MGEGAEGLGVYRAFNLPGIGRQYCLGGLQQCLRLRVATQSANYYDFSSYKNCNKTVAMTLLTRK